MQSPFSAGFVQNVDPATFTKGMSNRQASIWDGQNVCTRTAPLAHAKLCTYLRWFSGHGQTGQSILLLNHCIICQFSFQSSGYLHSSEWPLTSCQWTRSVSRRPRCPSICADALYVAPMAWAMSSISFLSASLFRPSKLGIADLFAAAGGAMRSLL